MFDTDTLYVKDAAGNQHAVMKQGYAMVDGKRVTCLYCVNLNNMEAVVLLANDCEEVDDYAKEAVDAWHFIKYQVWDDEKYDRRVKWIFHYHDKQRRVQRVLKMYEDGVYAETNGDHAKYFKFDKMVYSHTD